MGVRGRDLCQHTKTTERKNQKWEPSGDGITPPVKRSWRTHWLATRQEQGLGPPDWQAGEGDVLLSTISDPSKPGRGCFK